MKSLGRSFLFPLLAAGRPPSGVAPWHGDEYFPQHGLCGTPFGLTGDSILEQHAVH